MGGPVNLIRVSESQIYALVNRNVFFHINISNNSVIKCIKFSNLSITSFFYHNDVLTVGTIENRIETYNLSKFDPTATAVTSISTQKLEPVKVIEGVSGWVLEMKINNGLLYCGCDDRRIRVYSLDDMKQVEELAGHDDGVISIDFAGDMLYTGSYDHSIRSWDIKEMLHRIR